MFISQYAIYSFAIQVIFKIFFTFLESTENEQIGDETLTPTNISSIDQMDLDPKISDAENPSSSQAGPSRKFSLHSIDT